MVVMNRGYAHLSFGGELERRRLLSATISAMNRFVLDTKVYSRVGAEIVMRIISLTTCRQLLVDSHTGREEHSGASTVP